MMKVEFSWEEVNFQWYVLVVDIVFLKSIDCLVL